MYLFHIRKFRLLYSTQLNAVSLFQLQFLILSNFNFERVDKFLLFLMTKFEIGDKPSNKSHNLMGRRVSC